MKILMIVLTSLLLSACSFTTNPVTEIGARIVEKKIRVSDIEDTNKIILYYSSMHKYSDDIFAESDSLSIYSPMKTEWVLGRVNTSFDYADIIWTNNTEGYIELTIEGDMVKFDVERQYENDEEYIAIFRHYRTWYGYPAQALLLVAIPLDLLINIALLPITIPFNIMFDR